MVFGLDGAFLELLGLKTLADSRQPSAGAPGTDGEHVVFTFIGELQPERNDQGEIIRLMPQSLYANARGL
jgi:hypothetical protein